MGENRANEYYSTDLGSMYYGFCENILSQYIESERFDPVDLLFTSPPFPLNRAKKYGNLTGDAYLNWISELAPLFKKVLSPTGSIVIEIGNAWEPNSPTHSTLPIETLLMFKKSGDFSLCQEFTYYNPAKLPSPIEWVNKKRIRVKDSFTRIWWLSTTAYPKANNRNVLVEYSKQMKKLISSGKYNAGKRPSEYNIGASSFSKDNGGSIPSNVLIASNTTSQDNYLRYCREKHYTVHPARMPIDIAEFFIKFLTNPGDLVLDPFAGSNVTGAVAEKLNRRWMSIEANENYILGSIGRFENINMHI